MSPKKGSLEFDLIEGKFNLNWPSKLAFDLWFKDMQNDSVVQFTSSYIKHGSGNDYGCFKTNQRLICTRKKKPWEKQAEGNTKRTGCDCALIVKTYCGTSYVLGYFTNKHSHSLGDENLKYTYISNETKAFIASMLRQGMSCEYIVCEVVFRVLYVLMAYIG